MPAEPGEAAWADVREYTRRIHRLAMGALRDASGDRLAEIMPNWEISFMRAGAWLCGHDSYHTAQIRSMGVPGLKEAREKAW